LKHNKNKIELQPSNFYIIWRSDDTAVILVVVFLVYSNTQ